MAELIDYASLPAAIAYCRVSTSKQDLSMDQQRAACVAWCRANGYRLVASLSDTDVSGSTSLLNRPQGKHIVGAAAQEGAVVVVSTYLDRLFRDSLDGLRCMREDFAAAGLRVVLVNEALDLSTPTGRLQASIRLATAEYERELTAERTRNTSRRLQNDGRVYGHVPYGCVAIDGKLYREPEAWATRVRIVNELRIWPMRDVAATLRRERLRSPNGALGWSNSTLSRLLTSHDRRALLPLAPEDGAGQGAALEAGVSA